MMQNSKIDFIYLSEPDMIQAGVTDMPACIDTMEDMFRLLYQGDYRMAGPNNDSHGAMITFPQDSPFPHMPKPTADRRIMAMPAYLGGDYQMAGVKWYCSNIENRDRGLPRSILMFILSDADTGAPLALMSANLLSAYRTGAIAGVGARYYACQNAEVMGLVGPGVMGRTTLSACLAVRPNIRHLKIKGRGQHSIDRFIEWLAQTHPQVTHIEVVDRIEEAVADADIVSFCNSGEVGVVADYPLVKREWVKPGAFLAMPTLCNMDTEMERADVRKVVDNLGMYQAWFKEVPKPAHQHIPLIGMRFMDMIAEGKMNQEQLQDIAQVIMGEASGRNDDDEIIVMSVGGMPVEDVAWASVIYRNALKKGLGVQLKLWDTPVLY